MTYWAPLSFLLATPTHTHFEITAQLGRATSARLPIFVTHTASKMRALTVRIHEEQGPHSITSSARLACASGCVARKCLSTINSSLA
jgi:hypothetical protein